MAREVIEDLEQEQHGMCDKLQVRGRSRQCGVRAGVGEKQRRGLLEHRHPRVHELLVDEVDSRKQLV